MANGCHGTGWAQPTIAELVYGLEVVGPDGELLYFDETTLAQRAAAPVGVLPGGRRVEPAAPAGARRGRRRHDDDGVAWPP